MTMTRVNTSNGSKASSPNNPDRASSGGGKSQGFDAHKQIMRSNEAAAQAKAYDPDGLTRIFQEMSDNDGEEAEALAENGQLRKARAADEGGPEAPDVKKSKGARPQAADGAAQDDVGSDGVESASGTKSAATKAVARKTSGTVETASLSQRQESLVSRLVALPDDYRGLAAANTETTFDAVSALEERFASSKLWTRAPETQRASMTDQIVRTFREASAHA